MSNTICVKRFCHVGYWSFKWEGNKILACLPEGWTEVVKTSRKNKYGDVIFVPLSNI
jgi:hypothetical protein